MRPLIGITPQVDPDSGILKLHPNYFSALAHSGAQGVLLPLTEDPMQLEQFAERLDGFLLSGGPDPHPALYGELPIPGCRRIDPVRDHMECALLKAVLRRKKPVFGICRGIQILNVALGGTLWQDLSVQMPASALHEQQPPYTMPIHPVELMPGTILERCMGKRQWVNSMHHQAVRTVAPGLCAAAVAPDGVVEAICGQGMPFLVAVQWHPEFLFSVDASARALFHAFVEAASGANRLS